MQHENTHTHENHEGTPHAHTATHEVPPAHHTHHEMRSARIPGLSTQTAILIGAVIIAIAVLGHGYISKGNNNGSSLAYLESFTGKAPNTDLYTEGKKDGKVYFVEYSDSECPYCIAFHNTVSQIRKKYAGQITYLYRPFPLTQIHPDALPEAVKMNCVGKLKGETAYFDFMTKLFDYKVAKQVGTLSPEFMSGYLKTAGIAEADFNKCVADPAITEAVQQSGQDGSQAGVSGTPTSFILVKDGEDFKVIKRFEGAVQSALVTPLIDKALKS